jgi:hypothetical protein
MGAELNFRMEVSLFGAIDTMQGNATTGAMLMHSMHRRNEKKSTVV